MLKLFAALFLVMNPLFGLVADKISQFQDASQKEAPLATNEITQQLPSQEDIFVTSQFLPIYPQRNWDVPEPDLTSKTALVFDTNINKILFQKNGIYEARPIASLTKLMTALVTLDNADLNDNFYVTKEAVDTTGEMGSLRANEQMSVKSLLEALLIESSNDAAVALAQNIGAKILNEKRDENNEFSENSINIFVGLLNKKAAQMNLKNTTFFDPSGLDPQNQSSAWDIAEMLQAVLSHPVLRDIMQMQSADVLSSDGQNNHYLINTDKLLNLPNVIGGKTGYTEEAGNCMALAAKTPDNQEMLLIVVMGADDRIAETKTLLEWTKKAYLW